MYIPIHTHTHTHTHTRMYVIDVSPMNLRAPLIREHMSPVYPTMEHRSISEHRHRWGCYITHATCASGVL